MIVAVNKTYSSSKIHKLFFSFFSFFYLLFSKFQNPKSISIFTSDSDSNSNSFFFCFPHLFCSCFLFFVVFFCCFSHSLIPASLQALPRTVTYDISHNLIQEFTFSHSSFIFKVMFYVCLLCTRMKLSERNHTQEYSILLFFVFYFGTLSSNSGSKFLFLCLFFDLTQRRNALKFSVL